MSPTTDVGKKKVTPKAVLRIQTFSYESESESADSYLWQMDPDPDLAIFVIDLEDANKNKFLKKVCLLITFWRHIFQK